MSWWRNAVLYEVYLRSFKDSNNDGVGDLQGVREKLDYIWWLGVDGIWITPFFPSPMVDFGYDITDYCNVDPQFGSLEDFQLLLNDAHDRNIKVVIDFVPNHTSNQHPWFRESRSSRTAVKRDWYIWADPKGDGSPPTNWQSRFGGGSAWTFDEMTNQYYFHSFLPEQPDLNWRNSEVQDCMSAVLRFWFDMGVDGIRIDVCDRLIKDDKLRDNPINQNWIEGNDPAQRLLQPFTKDMPGIRKINKLFRSIANEYEDVCLIGESYLQVEKLASYYGNNDEYHLPFNFSLTVNNLTASNISEAIMRAEKAVPLWACSSWAFGNHDRSRVASREGCEKAKLVMMLLLTLNGTPTIYYGDELGMEDVIIPDNKVVDPWGIATPCRGRDKVRAPMPWNNSNKAGFCDVDVEPWLPFDSDYISRNVDSLSQDPNSILSMTRNLIALRRNSEALREGRMELEEGAADEVRFLRRTDNSTYRIQLNFGDTPIECMDGEVLFTTDVQCPSGQVRPLHGVVVRCVSVDPVPLGCVP